ncbi:proteasome regulatory particle base subunit [Coemansia sp. RSA 1797]|nr:proteasome regulatory particle base subunit [Coemansia sp. RSA 1797]
MIALLIEEEDPLLRLGAVHVITMAYCGTGDNGAIRKLLHLAVSDVKDDVRRAAVTGLGFILLRSPEQVPRMVELLSESFNPHVRVGAALALGIACAGSGSKPAIAILEPMLKDSVDFVVEGASIALAFILIQQNETYEPKVAEVRKRFATIIETKNSEGVSKFGAAIAQGIIDAGGRNVTIGLTTNDGQLNAPACAGMLVFTQFWYWFPLAHFLSLSFTPTALIAINKNLKAPNLDVTCVSRKALYTYPPNVEQPVVQAPTKIATAVLSTTKARRGKKSVADEPMSARSEEAEPVRESESMDVDDVDTKSAQKKARKAGSDSFAVSNIARLLPFQEKHMKWPAGARYVPVKQGRISGVLVVKDTMPGEPEDLVQSMLPDDLVGEEESVDVAMPEPFEYPFDADSA